MARAAGRPSVECSIAGAALTPAIVDTLPSATSAHFFVNGCPWAYPTSTCANGPTCIGCTLSTLLFMNHAARRIVSLGASVERQVGSGKVVRETAANPEHSGYIADRKEARYERNHSCGCRSKTWTVNCLTQWRYMGVFGTRPDPASANGKITNGATRQAPQWVSPASSNTLHTAPLMFFHPGFGYVSCMWAAIY